MRKLMIAVGLLANFGLVKASDLDPIFDRKTMESSVFCKKYACKFRNNSVQGTNLYVYELTKVPKTEICQLPNFKKCKFTHDLTSTVSISDGKIGSTQVHSIYFDIQSFTKGYWSIKQSSLANLVSDYLYLTGIKPAKNLIQQVLSDCYQNECYKNSRIQLFNDQKGSIEYSKSRNDLEYGYNFQLIITDYDIVN